MIICNRVVDYSAIDYFCKKQPEIEELYNLAPVVENLKTNTDKLNAFFIDNEEKVEN